MIFSTQRRRDAETQIRRGAEKRAKARKEKESQSFFVAKKKN